LATSCLCRSTTRTSRRGLCATFYRPHGNAAPHQTARASTPR
jgi:hypothetical protein